VIRTAINLVRVLGVRGAIRRVRAAAHERREDDRYPGWRARHIPDASELNQLRIDLMRVPRQPLISIVVPVYNTSPEWLSRCVESVKGQVYTNWQLCLHDDASQNAGTRKALDQLAGDPRIRVSRSGTNGGISRATNLAIANATGEFIAFVDHDDELETDALARVVLVLNADPSLDVVYTDEDKIDASGARRQPHFKPDWSPERLRSCMYVSHLTVMRRQLVVEAGGLRPEFDGAQDYDLMLRVGETTGRIGHVPRVLYGWRAAPGSAASSHLAKPEAIEAGLRALQDALHRQGSTATVCNGAAAGHYRVQYAIGGTTRVSVLLMPSPPAQPKRDVDALARSIAALRRHDAGVDWDLIVVRDGPLSAAAAGALRGIKYMDVEAAGAENIAGLVNRAAAAADSDHVLVMNRDVEAIEPGWMGAMLGLSRQQAIGAVGAFLLYPDGTIEHGGVVLGIGGLAAHAFEGDAAWSLGHRGNAADDRNCSAVSAACLMTRRDVFQRLGGFSERFARDLFDIDYGLKVWQAGLRVVITPAARLRHHTSRGGMRGVEQDEVRALRAEWGVKLDRDPYYNPNFERTRASFRLPPDFESHV
jgi:GT2 family glycosyltransferase